MVLVLFTLLQPATALDPDTSLYVGSDAGSAALEDAIRAFDTLSPTTTALQADVAAEGNAVTSLALDPLNDVLYARASGDSAIYAFDATDLTRLSSLDLDTGGGEGGAIELDPFRRILFTQDEGDLLQAWSIDGGASYGQLLDATAAVSGYQGTRSNALVRDPTTDALYAAANASNSGEPVRVYDCSGQSFSSFAWASAVSLGVNPSLGGGLALHADSSELLVHESSTPKGAARYDVSILGSASFAGSYTTRSDVLTGERGMHLVDDDINGVTLLVETDESEDTLYVYDLDAGTALTGSVLVPTGVEFQPLDESEADDDGDGLWDSVEVGATGLAHGDYEDTDPTTTTDPDDPDSDGDGLLDGEEDLDLDGALDTGETNPNEADTDGDGYDDGDDNCPLTENPFQDDLDGDGEGDGCDPDDDGDGYDAEDEGGTDCDDSDASVNPGATEVWYDGVDSDCADDNDYDADGDGYDSEDYDGSDCDDTDATVNPDARDYWYDDVDSNCDGASDFDMDGDGYDSATYGGEDCDDADPDTYPGAPDDPYDGVVNDCSASDEYDQDGDGYDAEEYGGNDCDDSNSEISPGAEETWYDGTDSDCDDESDYDADGDGYDAEEYEGSDCDDTDPDVHPDAEETWYDGTDADCAGDNDYDADGDGYEAEEHGGDDCDDTDADIYPGAEGWTEDCEPVEDTAVPEDTAPPEDTGEEEPADTDTPTDTGGPSEPGVIRGGGGCTCTSASSRGRLAGAGWLVTGLLALLGLRRRR